MIDGVNVQVSAYKCFYGELLQRPGTQFSLPPRGRSRKRPSVRDRATMRAILEAPHCLKHKAMLTLVYGSGLRVSEVMRLRPCHTRIA